MHNPAPVFRALADPTRRDILGLLARQDMSIGHITDHFDMTRPAVKKHLALLEHAELITVTAKGRERINRLNRVGFQAAESWLGVFDQFWDDRLSALKSAVEKDTAP